MDTNRAAAQIQALGRGLFANKLGVQLVVTVLAIFLDFYQIGVVQDSQMVGDFLDL